MTRYYFSVKEGQPRPTAAVNPLFAAPPAQPNAPSVEDETERLLLEILGDDAAPAEASPAGTPAEKDQPPAAPSQEYDTDGEPLSEAPAEAAGDITPADEKGDTTARPSPRPRENSARAAAADDTPARGADDSPETEYLDDTAEDEPLPKETPLPESGDFSGEEFPDESDEEDEVIPDENFPDSAELEEDTAEDTEEDGGYADDLAEDFPDGATREVDAVSLPGYDFADAPTAERAPVAPAPLPDDEAARAAKRKKALKIALPVAGGVLLVGIVLAVLFATGALPPGKLYDELTVEVGTENFDVSGFIKDRDKTGETASLVSGVFDLRRTGQYSLTILYKGKNREVKLIVTDTTPPEAVVKCALVRVGAALTEGDLVRDVKDNSGGKVAIEASKVDTTKPGVQPIKVRFTDPTGNRVEIDTRVYIATALGKPSFEIGSTPPDISAFVDGIEGMTLDPGFDFASLKTPGDTEIPLRCAQYPDDIIYASLTATDTIPPVAEPKTGVELFSTDMPDPATLLASVTDATETSAKYKETYTFAADGRYTLTVVVTDAGGNTVEVPVDVFVYVTDATEAPLIVGGDFSVEVGATVDFSAYVSVKDGKDGDIPLTDTSRVTIDSSALNTAAPGVYPVKITARDSDGNTAEKTINVTVAHKAVGDEEVKSYVNGILGGITNPAMSREQQIRTVFTYLTGDGALQAATSDKSGAYLTEAYYGFTQRKGDYYTYSSMARAMFDCLGIEYKVVNRAGTRLGDFCWLLVDFGDGWYHFDPSPHEYVWTKDTCKLTDAEAAAYTAWYDERAKGWNYYGFDRGTLPLTPVLNADGTYTYTPYTVTYSAGSGGSIEGETVQHVSHGASASAVRAVPADGFAFRGWSDGITTPDRTDLIKGDLNLVAEFTAEALPDKSYVFSYAAGEGGSIQGSAFQNVFEGYHGTTVTAVPNPGYLFAGWSDGVTTPERTDVATQNLAVTALFERDAAVHTLTYLPSTGGTIVGATPQQLAAGQTGTSVTATPLEGYRFLGWDDGETNPTRSDSITEDKTITALFERGSFHITYEAQEGGHVEGETVQTVDPGASGSAVRAVADPGYVFRGWSDGMAANERTDTPNDGDLTVTARFDKATGNVTVTYRAGEGGSISGNPEQTLKAWSTTEEVEAVPSEGYRFDRWDDGGTSARRSDTALQRVTYTAVFVRDSYKVTVSAGEGGSVSPAGETVAKAGEPLTLTATPAEGYTFAGWYSGDTLLSAEQTFSYTPQGDGEVTGRFAAAPVNPAGSDSASAQTTSGSAEPSTSDIIEPQTSGSAEQLTSGSAEPQT